MRSILGFTAHYDVFAIWIDDQQAQYLMTPRVKTATYSYRWKSLTESQVVSKKSNICAMIDYTLASQFQRIKKVALEWTMGKYLILFKK